MDELYIVVYSEVEDGCVVAPLESLVTLFTHCYCGNSPLYVVLVLATPAAPAFTVRLAGLHYELRLEVELPNLARACQLPVVLLEGATVVSGLCAVLRQIAKHSDKHFLLGFRQGCLVAPAETSTWTRFCEVDVIATVKSLINSDLASTSVIRLPVDVARFEMHMAQPLRVHNISKRRQDLAKSTAEDVVLEHCFAEGPTMTLADVVLFPCLHIALETIRSVYLKQNVPLTSQWLDLVRSKENMEECMGLLRNVQSKVADELYVSYMLPDVPRQSLYKSNPHRYKPKARVFTRQDEVEASLQVAGNLGAGAPWHGAPPGWELQFDWEALPPETHPEGGSLPPLRRERKGQQLENLTKAVLKIARPGHTIVDFCSGSGHLGIILAHLLPRCQVVLLENKEESLGRARQRVGRLRLVNITFCQCNLDYFQARFDIGVSLHACGVATDLVLQSCILQGAAFVCCPCCYGSVQDNHSVSYPRSRAFKESGLTLRQYLVLGHSADQTHDEGNAKTGQGRRCMALIDTDRSLQATENGYTVSLAKLVPESCTPKNNLLVGTPSHWPVSDMKE